MRILFDYQVFSWQKVGGVSRVFREVIAEAAALRPDCRFSIVAGMHLNDLVGELANRPRVEVHEFLHRPAFAPGFGHVARFVNPRFLECQAKAFRPDVFHPTWHDADLSRIPEGTAVAATIHDLIPENLPEFFPAYDPGPKRRLLERADVVITVSNQTRTDLLERFPHLSANRVFVAPLAARLQPPSRPAAFDRPFLLHVGRRGGYKNFRFLLDVFANSPELRGEFQLVCFGGGRPDGNELEAIARAGLDRRQIYFTGGDDQTLAACYTGAAAFVTPSLYEGFGIPLLEAMSCGTPVVASRGGSIPDVAGDAAMYFDARDAESLREALRRTLFDSGRRQTLCDAGVARVKQFSWAKCADRHLDAWEYAANSGAPRTLVSNSSRPASSRSHETAACS